MDSRHALTQETSDEHEAAAPYSSLAFLFWGAGLVVFPLMLLYTVISYSVFRGKVQSPSLPYH
jgi:cytochrome bd ubiquinol oxidase subunit II